MAPPRKAVSAAVAALALIAGAQATQYKVVWHYNNGDCSNPPVDANFDAVATCAQISCMSMGGLMSDATCAPDVSELVPSDGSKGDFVILGLYSDAACTGDPTEGNLYATNQCNVNGANYDTWTCEGGKALFKKCPDSTCSTGCTVQEEHPTDSCTSGGGNNFKYSCSSTGGGGDEPTDPPGGDEPTDPPGGDEPTDPPGGSDSHASTLAINSAAVVAVALAAAASAVAF